RSHVGPWVGGYGWNGWYGIIWYIDPAGEMTAILMNQGGDGRPRSPVFPHFFSAGDQAIDDSPRFRTDGVPGQIPKDWRQLGRQSFGLVMPGTGWAGAGRTSVRSGPGGPATRSAGRTRQIGRA